MTEQQKGALDLSAFDAAVKRQEQGIEVDILGPDGETPIGLKIKVAGPDSQRAQKAQEELADGLLEKQARKGKIARVKPAEARKRGIMYLARVTIGWSPAVKLDGKELAYSVENAERLYTALPFIREQVDEAGGDRARFMKG